MPSRIKIRVILLICLTTVILGQTPMTLDDCFDAALENSPSVQAAQERLAQARAKVIQARGAFLPSMSASAAYVRLDTEPYVSMGDMTEMLNELLGGLIPPDTTSQYQDEEEQRLKMGEDENYDVTLSATQPIFTGFGILSGYRMASLGMKAERINFDSAREDLLYSVENAYWQHIKALGFLQVAKKSHQQVKAHVEDLVALEGQGMASHNNVLAARVRESEMKLTVLRAKQGVTLSRLALATLIGIPVESIDIEEQVFEKSSPFEDADEALNTARTANTDIKKLDIAWRIADAGVTAAASPLYPSAMVIGSWHYKKPNRELENEWYDSWDITAALNLNVFDWGITIGKIKDAKAVKRELEANRNLAINALDLRVKGAYSTYVEAVAGEEVADEQVKLAEENFRVTTELFNNSAATSTTLLDAQSDLLRAEVNLLSARADRAIARAELIRLTGGYIKYFSNRQSGQEEK